MFEKAGRIKLRFGSTKGLLSAEDLWDLPLTSVRGVSLDGIAKAVHRELKDSSEVSFVAPSSPENAELELKFEIVKHIISVRIKENADRSDAVKRKETKEKILNIISKKQDAAYEDKSIAELQALIA